MILSQKLKSFIAELPSELFGINYDIGNSASLGYDFYEEFDSYFERIIHIHIKIEFNGTTVPLGEGNANLDCFKILRKEKYEGNFSMQTARDPSGKHVQAMLRYIKIVDELLDMILKKDFKQNVLITGSTNTAWILFIRIIY